MIGLCGAHRTGKTTMAKAWAERSGVEFVTISASEVIKNITGGSCGEITDIETRLKVQRGLVQACDRAFLRRKNIFVTDRTPLDVAAYTMAEAQQNNLSMDQQREVVEIVEDCIDITNASFGALLMIYPGLPYVVEEGKPPMNTAYQEHISSLITGFLADYRMKVNWWHIRREVADLDDRVGGLGAVYEALTEDFTYEAEGAFIN